jgi:hypothetical protein
MIRPIIAFIAFCTGFGIVAVLFMGWGVVLIPIPIRSPRPRRRSAWTWATYSRPGLPAPWSRA